MIKSGMGNIALAYIKAILLYWLTLKDGSEVWLVEPAWVATRANNRNTLIEQSPRWYIKDQRL